MVPKIIVLLKVKNQVEDDLSGEEKDKKIQEKPLQCMAKGMVHIHELRRFFEDQSNVGDFIFV